MRSALRCASLAVLFCAAASCSPEIGAGTYFCGPDKLCPEGLVCDEPTTICERDFAARPFECPAGSEAGEPDDTLDQAPELGTFACGATAPLSSARGCIDSPSAIDLYKFEYDDECSGIGPFVSVRLRHPIGLGGLQVELLDASGALVKAAEPCTLAGDFSGTELLCIDETLASGSYFLRVTAPADATNCDGDCHYNRYSLSLSFPAS